MKCKFDRVVFKIARSIFARTFFTILSLVAIWEVADSHYNKTYWLLTLLLIPLVVESFYTLIKRKGHEYRWLCPSVLCFLVATIPPIWLLELNMLDRRIAKAENPEHPAPHENPINQTTGFHLPAHISRETQVTTVEQFQLIMIVLSRLILPKGSLNRDELSQMLLTYIGIMADIVEFFSNFKELAVSNDRSLTCAVLSLWAVSILHFIFVFGSMKPRDWRLPHLSNRNPTDDDDDNDDDPLHYSIVHVCLSTDLWVMTLMVLMMDVPFLLFRMVLIFYHGIVNHTVFFFTVKNAIVILLQTYRVVALLVDRIKHKGTDEPHQPHELQAAPRAEAPGSAADNNNK